MPTKNVTLDDKYDSIDQPVLINGAQAIVRLLLTQRQRDAAIGWKTAGFVSGYRGSPLGALDMALWDAKVRLEKSDITFMPGVNEDLAAAAVWGTQQLRSMKEATVDGVFALWYGKGPGVDRSGDPIKHGNYAGSDAKGGVLVLFGDDHPGKSSTIAHHSEQALAANQLPILYPADVGEFIRFGLLGWGMSRYSGCWVGMKVVNETIEQTATIGNEAVTDIEWPTAGELPPEGVHFRGVYAPARDEMILKRYRLPLVHQFCRANRIDRAVFGVSQVRLGLVSAGKAFQDTMQALQYLGIDAARANALGLDVYRVGMIWPLEPQGMRAFAASCEELFFIEEKSAFLEPQAQSILYAQAHHPRIVGKQDEAGKELLPQDLSLDPLELAIHIAARIEKSGIQDAAITQRLTAARALRGAVLPLLVDGPKRMPYFCAGCPHNTSTNVPEGSTAISGIGCHGMALWARPGTVLGMHMGGEGMNWVGMHRYTSTPHVFQNLGDGTYFHSGLLAIRQAVASGANITYKILYNDAVAMTGGQPVDGTLSPSMIASQVLAEGVTRVMLVSEDPSRYDTDDFLPKSVKVSHRSMLDEVQRELRDIPGCSVLIYEQTCAAEKRRRRKRREMVDPPKRLVINEAVCEGCGDCSVQSNCVAIQPLETPLGLKRQIDQTSCNKDYSCVKGFCPSFVTVIGAEPRKRNSVTIDAEMLGELMLAPIPSLTTEGYAILVSGIGGTGVITVGAILAMAAHVQGAHASVYDMTGLAQKNGAVYSHIRLASGSANFLSQRIGLGQADLLLAFDMVAGLGPDAYRSLRKGTRVLGNSRVQPTAAFQSGFTDSLNPTLLLRRLEARVGCDHMAHVDATGLASALFGDTIATNMFMVGVALQMGWIPLQIASVERAIELNGVQVAFNLRALRLGRLWVCAPGRLKAMLPTSVDSAVTQDLDGLIEDRANRLATYQNQAYAKRFRQTINEVRKAEEDATGGSTALTEAACRSLYGLMAYKDEYEVARLMVGQTFLKRLASEFEDGARIRFNMAPPLLARTDPATGRPRKSEFGAWLLPVLRALARLRFLRGTVFDPFGFHADRRCERELITQFEETLRTVCKDLSSQNLPLAVQLAEGPQMIKGYGPVKSARIDEFRAKERQWLAAWAQPDPVASQTI
jgi:indolepyruvate ferredoxin oxidoreductase